ncbi:hypothetical protein B14911_22197 [Bacillus sp. NRRL B-14911]|nr:hypothetical protein B14911_22197 [Bacillus sp. NRRL B-14911]
MFSHLLSCLIFVGTIFIFSILLLRKN